MRKYLKVMKMNLILKDFERLFLTVGEKKIEVGTKGNCENAIVILHAYGNIPSLDIEIPKGKTDIPEEYIKLAEKNTNFNNDYINDFEKLSDELSKKYKVVVINRPATAIAMTQKEKEPERKSQRKFIQLLISQI